MPDLRRKIPVQTRALRTVDTLLDAAAQVLHDEGEQRFTTNRVAEVAGFSIGTLYQYFPNKDAIVAALVARELLVISARMAAALAKIDPDDLEEIVRVAVRTAIGAFGRRRKIRHFVIVQMVRLNLGATAIRAVDDFALTFVRAIAACGGARVRPLSDVGSFVLTRAIMATIRAAVMEDRPILDDPAFEDELARLALRFVLA